MHEMIEQANGIDTGPNEQPEEENIYVYEEVAGRIARLIEQGTFRTGDRIPSVRNLSRQMQVSISTVVKAYFLLENHGLIEARPQSGYYVRSRSAVISTEPESLAPFEVPTRVSISELVMMVMRDMRNPDIVPLGVAIPNPELLPVDKLNRALFR